MRFKRLISVFIAVFMLLTFAGCKKTDKNNTSDIISSGDSTVLSDTINLLCCYSDTLNPYTAASEINRNLTKLMFDSLIKLDNNFEPINCLAESVSADGVTFTVKLKSSRFSDGSTVTADDVVYSYNLARASATVYASQLYEVASISASDALTVNFTLTRQDPYFERLLDFPILKSGSDKRTDIDDVVLPPIGSGRYVPNEECTELIRNDNYMGKKGTIKNIKLILTMLPSAISV